MPPNQVDFENLHFNSFNNKYFSNIEDGRDPDENFFNKVNTQNFECSYFFPNELESFLFEKEKFETINAIHKNIRNLSKNFDSLLDILRDSICSLWKSKTRVTSYKFKSTSYEFKSTNYEFKCTSCEFKSRS